MKEFLFGLFFYLLFLLFPFIFGYAIYEFINWGAYPYPSQWLIESRKVLAFVFVIWFMAVTIATLNILFDG